MDRARRRPVFFSSKLCRLPDEAATGKRNASGLAGTARCQTKGNTSLAASLLLAGIGLTVGGFGVNRTRMTDTAPFQPRIATPPAPGQVVEVADGILWTRLALPLRLDHVNVYLLEDGPGFALFDTGMDLPATREAWTALLRGPLKGRPITRVIVSHAHPDHVGAAGWLCATTEAPLVMTGLEYLLAIVRRLPGEPAFETTYFISHGVEQDLAAAMAAEQPRFGRLTGPPPSAHLAVAAGDTLEIGGRSFAVLTGGGHADEQLMLHCPDDDLFLAADQVIAGITPNIGVWPMQPLADPLTAFLRSLADLAGRVGERTLVLPGHKLPFHDLPGRVAELQAHHARLCDQVLRACLARPRTIADLIGVLFPRALDPFLTRMAFAEAAAHVNYLIGLGQLAEAPDAAGRLTITAR